MSSLKRLIALILAAAAISVPVEAHSHDGSQTASTAAAAGGGRGAHVHGLAELLVALEGEQLLIELLSPAVNLVGFEGTADSLERQVAIADTRETLQDAGKLFQIGSGKCRVAGHEVDFGHLVTSSGAYRAAPAEEQDESGHRNQDHQARTHSDIRASYYYHCERPQELESLLVRLQRHFPGIQSVQVQWIANGRQGMATLDNSQTPLVFR